MLSTDPLNINISLKDLVALSSHVDLRLGRMLKVEKHPSADKLYVEQVDFGTEMGIRTVISGLVPYFSPEQIQDRLCVFVANIKPASMRGMKSEAMVLVAHGVCGKVEFIEPPKGSNPGERVFFHISEEFKELGSSQPDHILNPKKKIWETIQPTLGIRSSDRSIVLRAVDGSEAILVRNSDPVQTPTLSAGIIS